MIWTNIIILALALQICRLILSPEKTAEAEVQRALKKQQKAQQIISPKREEKKAEATTAEATTAEAATAEAATAETKHCALHHLPARSQIKARALEAKSQVLHVYLPAGRAKYEAGQIPLWIQEAASHYQQEGKEDLLEEQLQQLEKICEKCEEELPNNKKQQTFSNFLKSLEKA